MRRNLLDVFMEVVDKPVDEQSAIIGQKIRDWRGDTPQVDDMTLVGIRV